MLQITILKLINITNIIKEMSTTILRDGCIGYNGYRTINKLEASINSEHHFPTKKNITVRTERPFKRKVQLSSVRISE